MYAYSPSNLESISANLTKVFASMQGEEENYIRSAGANIVIPVMNVDNLPAIEDIIDAFAIVLPSRFFVIVSDKTKPNVLAEISARCHVIAKNKHVCSEVVRFVMPPSQFEMIPSLLRANFLIGVDTQLFLHDANLSQEIVEVLTPLADMVILDSSRFSHFWSFYQTLLAKEKVELLDLEWIGLGLWRDQVRAFFDIGVNQQYLNALEDIEIRGSEVNGPELFLLAGWLMDRLQLDFIKKSGTQYLLQSLKGTTVILELKGGSQEFSLQSLALSFKLEGSTQIAKLNLIRSKDRLDITSTLKGNYEVAVRFEESTLISRIQKYYSIGESTTNYAAALRNALSLRGR